MKNNNFLPLIKGGDEMGKDKIAERDRRRARRRSRKRSPRPTTHNYRVPMDKHPIIFTPSGYIGPFLAIRRIATIILVFLIAAGLVTTTMYVGKSDFGAFDMLITFLNVIPKVLLITIGWAILGIPHLLLLFFVEWSAVKQMRPSRQD